MRRAAGIAAVLLLALGAGTWWAGEQTEVAVLRTTDAAGALHHTRLWVVDVDGTPWVRVGRPGRAWFRRLLAQPEVELVRNGVAVPCRAVPIPSPDPATAERVDQAFADKYGWADRWYGLLLRSGHVMVRLDPRSVGPREAMGS